MLKQTEVQKSVYTAFRDSPFALQESVKEVYVKAGSSIQEIIDESIKEEWQHKYLRVVLNDEVIKPEDYALTFVNEKDVVGMVLVPHDGEVGQIFKAIAVIAIVVAVTWALGPAGFALVGAELAAGIGAAVGLAATLALNALFPPPVPGLPSMGSSGSSEDPVYGFSKTGNSLSRYNAIPRIYGCRKVFPNHAIAPYIIAQGTDQYLYQAFTVGYGPIKIEDIRIGENAIGNYKDVEYYVHESFVAGDELKIVKEDNWQDPYSIALLKDVDHIISTTDEANAASLSIQFPQGMFYMHPDGRKTGWGIDLRVEIRQSGTSSWYFVTDFNPVVTDGSIESTVTQNSWSKVGVPYFSNPNYSVVAELPESSTVVNNEYKTLVTSTTNDYFNTIDVFQDYQNHYSVATSTNIVHIGRSSSRPFITNVNVVFPTSGKWDIKVTRITDDYDDNTHYALCSIASLRSIKNIAPIATDKPIGLIELKIKATDQLNGAVTNLSCIVKSKLPVWNGSSWSVQETRNPAWAYLDVMRGSAAKKPIADSRIDIQAFKDWADWCDETQPNFAFTPPTTPNTATNVGYVTNLYYTILYRVPDTDGLTNWVAALDNGETRSNVYRFFMQSAEAATIRRACCDLEVTSTTTAWEVLKLIAATGYATPSQNGGKYSITVDKTKDTPVQVFTPKNIKSFSGSMSYYVKPHALRISYTKTNETDTDEIIVYDDGYNADGSGGKTQATVFEEMKLVGISRYNQAYTIGRRSLAQGQLRIETFTISCDVENLLATRGSLVRLQHDVPKIGSGSGRVVAVSGSTITIDEAFKLTTGSIYAHVRHLDGTQSNRTLSSVSGSQATISGTALSEGDLIVYGQLNSVDIECIVKSVRPSNDLTATLELVPYAPAIYTADTEEIPDRDPFINEWSGGTSGGGTNTGNVLTPGLVTSLLGSYQITYDNKTPRITVTLSWSPPVVGGTVAKYQIWYEDTAGWRLLGETTELIYLAFNEYVFTDADGNIIDFNGKALIFAVAGVGSDGSSVNPDYAKQVTVTPTISAPNEIASLTATPHYLANELGWVFTNDPFATAFVEVWGSITNSRSSATRLAKVDADINSFVHSGLDPDKTWFYWVVAADGSGNFSAWYPATNSSSVSAKPLTAKTQYIDISGFTGFNVNAGGTFTPTNATLTAIVTGVTNPTYSWLVTGATTGATNQSTLTVTPNNSDSKVSVTLTVNGDNVSSALTKTIVMPITYNGAAGEAGSNGTMSAFPTIYQWTANSTPPARPTTTSTYTWGTGAFTPPSGWFTYAPSNTTPGAYLWSITVPLVTVATTDTNTLDWTNTSYPIRSIAYNGTNGSAGTPGSNGSGTFVIARTANDSSAPTAAEVLSAIGRSPVAGDLVTVSYNNYNNGVVYRYTTGWSLFSTYITGSLIVQNTITGDKLVAKTIKANLGLIDNAAVDTLQLAGNSVTVPSYFEGNGEINNIGNTATTIITGVITTTGNQPIVIQITSGIGGGSSSGVLNTVATDCTIFVYIENAGGTVQSYKTVNQGVSVAASWMESFSGSCVFTASEVPAGTWYIRVKARCNQAINGSSIFGLFARYPRMTALETKR